MLIRCGAAFADTSIFCFIHLTCFTVLRLLALVVAWPAAFCCFSVLLLLSIGFQLFHLDGRDVDSRRWTTDHCVEAILVCSIDCSARQVSEQHNRSEVYEQEATLWMSWDP